MKRAVASSMILLVVMTAFASCGRSLKAEIPSPSIDQPTTSPAVSLETGIPSSNITKATTTAASTTKGPKPGTTRPNVKRLDFSAQHIRTFGYHPGRQYPIITVVQTKQELDRYYESYKDQYDFGSRAVQYEAIDTIGFTDATANYTDGFFKDSYLVIVLFEEGGGSIRHRVERVAENGEILIRRLVPPITTLDIAVWSIIIEVNSGIKPARFQVDMIDEAVQGG